MEQKPPFYNSFYDVSTFILTWADRPSYEARFQLKLLLRSSSPEKELKQPKSEVEKSEDEWSTDSTANKHKLTDTNSREKWFLDPSSTANWTRPYASAASDSRAKQKQSLKSLLEESACLKDLGEFAEDGKGPGFAQ